MGKTASFLLIPDRGAQNTLCSLLFPSVILERERQLFFKGMLSCCSCVRLFVAPRTVARQVPLSMEFSQQEYGSELPCPPPGDLPDPEIEPGSLMSPALAGVFFYQQCHLQSLFLKGLIVNILGTGGCKVSVATTQLCSCSFKTQPQTICKGTSGAMFQ